GAYLDDPWDLMKKLGEVLPRTEAVRELKGRTCPGPLGRGGTHRAVGDTGRDEEHLFFLKSLEPVRKELESGRAVRVPGHGGRAVLIKGASKALVKRLHDGSLCLGCFWHWERDPEEPPEPATLGLFGYQHTVGNIFSGPYGLYCRPLRPAHIDQLPPTLRREARSVYYDFCFARRGDIAPDDDAQNNCS